MTNPFITQGSPDVFEDLGFPTQEAQDLIIRADLILQLQTLTQAKK